MMLTPQPYPLWLAQVVDNEVQTGRVIGWIVRDLSASGPDASAAAQPLVVFADDNGFVWATMAASRTAPRFMCEERAEAAGAAERWVADRRRGSTSDAASTAGTAGTRQG